MDTEPQELLKAYASNTSYIDEDVIGNASERCSGESPEITAKVGEGVATPSGVGKEAEGVILVCPKNNCNIQAQNWHLPLTFDCRIAYKLMYFFYPETLKRSPFACKGWNCVYCSTKNRWKLKNKVINDALTHDFVYFSTVTMNTKETNPGKESCEYLSYVFKKVSIAIKRKYGSWTYGKVTELTKKGYCHFHIAHSEFLDVNWLRRTWVNAGGGRMMLLEVIRDVKILGEGETKYEGIADYLSSYMSKADMRLPKGVRHYSTNVKKEPVKTEIVTKKETCFLMITTIRGKEVKVEKGDFKYLEMEYYNQLRKKERENSNIYIPLLAKNRLWQESTPTKEDQRTILRVGGIT
jgi:hypothetical protein